jgi:hypothetical protein
VGKGARIKEERRMAAEKLKQSRMEAQTLMEKRLQAQRQREDQMRADGVAEVMIKCPKTGNFVPTGIVMDAISYQGSSMSNNSFAPCPECGRAHRWSDTETMLAN